MDPDRPFLIALDAPGGLDEQIAGGKAAKLAQLTLAGFAVPRGFCLTTWAYDAFVTDAKITAAISMELGRKSMDGMRWEEIWDAALRIRSLFLAQPLSKELSATIALGLKLLNPSALLVVRSSAIGEDSAGHSFAGLHESILKIHGQRATEDAVRVVWASLWSDAALLYRQELGLDPARSRMAVVVQEMVHADRSGVAFARDPRDLRRDHAIIESVAGPCSLLVDGLVDPDRWIMNRETRSVVAWHPGQREGSDNKPLLQPEDLETIVQTLFSIEQMFHWPPDLEWTGRSDSLTVLQARPIAKALPDDDEKRSWYLTLRPGDARLKKLRQRIAGQLIPELEAAGAAFAAEHLELLDDERLAAAIEERSQAIAKWKKIYWDEFIPFAHGVRRLATYYNDAVQPDDPYEFVGLLRNQPLLAAQRNSLISELARLLGLNPSLRIAVEECLRKDADSMCWSTFRDELLEKGGAAEEFLQRFDDLRERFLDVTFDDERLGDRPGHLLRNLVELSQSSCLPEDHRVSLKDYSLDLEKKLLAAVGLERHAEAVDVIETGRVSWRLRDDDNLLVARLDSQCVRALDVAARRLRELGRLTGDGHLDDSHIALLVRGLREPSTDVITIADSTSSEESRLSPNPRGHSPRQLIGQPASPGLATGLVRCIRRRDDLGKFRRGEILVCDAIQPTMTHLVPLSGGIVERRGGMLIHGAIIAREMGIPCVNGVRDAADVLKNGDLVTVDGHLGIVTIGTADFDLEVTCRVSSDQSLLENGSFGFS